MTIQLAAERLLLVAAAFFAWREARASPTRRQRCLARVLVLLATIHCARGVLALLRPGLTARIALWEAGAAPLPYRLASRASWALDVAFVLAWYVLEAVAVARTLADHSVGLGGESVSKIERLARVVSEAAAKYAAKYSKTIPALALGVPPLLFVAYPALRGAPAQALFAAAFWASLAVQLAATARFLRRRQIPGGAETAALLLAASTTADIVGPWLLGHPARDWQMGSVPAILTWAVIAAWEARCLLSARGSG